MNDAIQLPRDIASLTNAQQPCVDGLFTIGDWFDIFLGHCITPSSTAMSGALLCATSGSILLLLLLAFVLICAIFGRPAPAAGSPFSGCCGLDPGGTTTGYEELKLTCLSDGDSIASIDYAVWGVPVDPNSKLCSSWAPKCGRLVLLSTLTIHTSTHLSILCYSTSAHSPRCARNHHAR